MAKNSHVIYEIKDVEGNWQDFSCEKNTDKEHVKGQIGRIFRGTGSEGSTCDVRAHIDKWEDGDVVVERTTMELSARCGFFTRVSHIPEQGV